jgi:signal transduction histidine kinase
MGPKEAEKEHAAARKPARTILYLLIRSLVCWTIPAWITIALGILGFYYHARQKLGGSTISIARALSAAVDRELASAVSNVQVLALSPRLASDDFKAFQDEATAALPYVFGNNIVLLDRSGAQLLNTLRPFGESLPVQGATPQTSQVFETGRPVVSDVFIGPVAKRPLSAIEVPVFRDGQVKYSLAVGIFTERLQELLARQGLSENWIVAVFDSSGTIAARTHSPDRFVGGKVSSTLQATIAQGAEGASAQTTLEGIRVFTAYSISRSSHWGVAIGIPASELSNELRNFFLFGGVGAFSLLGLSLMLKIRQANRIAHSVRDLIPSAVALGRGLNPNVPRLQVQEADEVAQAIDQAYHLLQDRTAERDQAQREKQVADAFAQEISAAYRQVEAANKELEQFAYAASHDLKAPLRVIDNASRWLEEDLNEYLTDDTRESMTLLRGRVKRMEKLLDDLLAYSRIGRKPEARQGEIISGNVLISDILALLVVPQNFTINVSPAFAPISVFRMPLQQVLLNLIGNAIKHHDREAGIIDVTVEEEAAFYVFTVTDDGPGIPVRFQEDVFKMFYTLKPRDQLEGSGMGLAMVRKYIEVSGGKVHLESGDNRGCAFRFTWPKTPQSQPIAA